MTAQAQTQDAAALDVAPELQEANFFELRRGAERITFTAENFTGQPQLNYHDGQRDRVFTGPQITLETTALGQLVTVESVILDGPTRKITLVLPTVRLAGKPEKVGTLVVYTRVAGPILRVPPGPGPIETYEVKTFRGTARFVIS
jgi:hypothetical protein